ncbi:unnamed protein product [Acanthosepion pharaonis]|uniref:Uncharacterized protein n=1 Tax=Acanthosepion pharaonis TaxID=158019 RepID=A0A812BVX0_ACAPH|nr:unnamed protein product [Sepia pharaonis]
MVGFLHYSRNPQSEVYQKTFSGSVFFLHLFFFLPLLSISFLLFLHPYFSAVFPYISLHFQLYLFFCFPSSSSLLISSLFISSSISPFLLSPSFNLHFFSFHFYLSFSFASLTPFLSSFFSLIHFPFSLPIPILYYFFYLFLLLPFFLLCTHFFSILSLFSFEILPFFFFSFSLSVLFSTDTESSFFTPSPYFISISLLISLFPLFLCILSLYPQYNSHNHL